MNTQKTLVYVTSVGLLATMILLGVTLMLCNKMADKIVTLETKVKRLDLECWVVGDRMTTFSNSITANFILFTNKPSTMK